LDISTKMRAAFRTAASMVLALSWLGTVGSRAGAAEESKAEFPQGHYAQLNSLPDWGGIWTFNFAMPAPGSQPVLKGKYLQEYQAWQRAIQKTHGDVPQATSHCMPPGMPIIMMAPQYPMEFFFTPGRVTTHHEAWMQWRNIYTDSRGHPADLDPTFNGNSIGHWDGQTLVVDTVGIKSITEIGMGMKHGDKLHIVERIHLAKNDPDMLVDELTLEDPQALEKPWLTKLTYKRGRHDQLLEFVCEENDRNPVDAAGKTEFK
jgi:hypothetical protein